MAQKAIQKIQTREFEKTRGVPPFYPTPQRPHRVVATGPD